jgi:hypothetical protein
MSLYTHYVAVFALALQNAIALIYVWRQRDKMRLRIWLAMQVCVLLLFAPWIPFALYQVAGENGNKLGAGLHTLLFRLPLQLFMAFSLGEYSWRLPLWMTVAGLLGFLTFVLCGLFAPEPNSAIKEKHRRWVTQDVVFCLIYLLFAAFGALVLYGIKPFRPTRLALLGLPAFYILTARGIERIRLGSKAKLTAVTALTALSLFAILTNVYQMGSQEDWRGVVNYVLNRSQPGDVVVLHPFYIYKPFNYYVAAQTPTYADLVGVDYPLEDIPAMVQKIAQGHNRLWLVLSRMNYVDPGYAVKKYLDAHYRMLDERHFQGIDGVLLYEL